MALSRKEAVKNIKLGTRAREDYGDLDVMKESLEKYGQMHPIVVTNDLELIAGGRRLTAAILLGWDEIEVKNFGDLTKTEKLELELEENLIRKDLTWQESVALKKSINELKKSQAIEKGEKWTNEDTSELLNESQSKLAKDLELADAVEKFPEITKCKTKQEARTLARRKKSAESRLIQNALIPKEMLSEGDIYKIHKGDSREILKDIPDNTADLIIADPPYAIDFPSKERNQQFIDTYGDLLTDEIRQVMAIVEPVMEECARILKPGGHLYLFFGIQHYNSFHSALELTWMLNIQSTPLFWIKSSGENYKPYHRYTVNYESFFFAWKHKDENYKSGQQKFEQKEFSKPHVSTFENHKLNKTKKEHPAQKPLSLYKDIIETSSHKGDVVLDPFLGSGISLTAAKQLERRIIGVEMLDDWYNLALNNVNNFESYKEE